jgi:hypothetical protein
MEIKTKKENCIILDSLLYYYEYNDKLNNDQRKLILTIIKEIKWEN